MDDEPALKKRRRPGACDNCKKRKIRCDSSRMPNNICTQCVSYGVPCTHMEVIKNLGSAKTYAMFLSHLYGSLNRVLSYVDALETRILKLEKIVQKYAPGIDLKDELDNTTLDDEGGLGKLKRNDDDSPESRLITSFHKLRISPDEHRYFGRSSSVMLVKTMLDVKRQCNLPEDRARDFKRPEFWTTRPWQVRPADIPALPYIFPEEDLLSKLIHLYFEKINLFFPLLHRPTFQRYIDQGLHHSDHNFAHVVLLLCGCAARYTDDSRVFIEDLDDVHTAGWQWVNQVKVIRSNMIEKPTLFEVQAFCLSVMYNQSSSAPQGVWTEVGLAIRMCMEVGAHRRRYEAPTVQSELWKRAFWVLVCLETTLSAFLGFQGSLQHEHFDLDLPIACDDEYWETGDSKTAFKQPSGRPSKIEFFNSYLKLQEIYTATFSAVYYTRKPRLVCVRPTDAQTVAMLDYALNSWLSHVPEYLRWDPERADPIFFDQSACLMASYHHLQIFVHKPFITPLESMVTSLTFPSLAICTFAARSCARLVEVQSKRSLIPLPPMQTAVFTSALVLLLNIWTGRQSGLTPNAKDLEDVRICMDILKGHEQRWHGAGRKWDILHGLAYAADVGSPGPAPRDDVRKRRRDEDTADIVHSSPTYGTSPASASSSPPYSDGAEPTYGAATNRESAPSGSSGEFIFEDFVSGYMNSQNFPGPSANGAPSFPPLADQSTGSENSSQSAAEQDVLRAMINAPDQAGGGPLTVNEELAMLLGDAAPPPVEPSPFVGPSSMANGYSAYGSTPLAFGLGDVGPSDMAFTGNGGVEAQGMGPEMGPVAGFGFDFNTVASTGMSMWNAPMGMNEGDWSRWLMDIEAMTSRREDTYPNMPGQGPG
ncbi:fungal-specific transcription factor domain-containing protein [Schizophyllum fasciatum]